MWSKESSYSAGRLAVCSYYKQQFTFLKKNLPSQSADTINTLATTHSGIEITIHDLNP